MTDRPRAAARGVRNLAYAAARRQAWLYDRRHDSMHPGVRRAAHALLRLSARLAQRRHLRPPSLPKNAGLNLGSGRDPLAGWVNVDINPFSRAEVWLDLRDRWPVATGSVPAIYTRHCLEHFDEADVLRILRQSARVLRPGGGIRVGVPSLDAAVERYVRRDFACADWLDPQQPAAKNFFAYITDNGNHLIVLDFEYLRHLLAAAGFTGIAQRSGGVSAFLDPSQLAPKDSKDDEATLYVEAVKP